MPDLAPIRAKLYRLRDMDPNLCMPGARHHKYGLNPPLQQGALDEFRSEFGVALPEGYAAFLLQLGNGGAGPGTGMHPLEHSVELYRSSVEGANRFNRPVPRLDFPFPFGNATARALVEDEARTRQRGEIAYEVEGEPDGALSVCSQGHIYYTCLILTGEQRGTMWLSEAGRIWSPHGYAGRQIGFLGWYEGWLDRWLVPGAIEEWHRLFGRR